jgi:plastocyanin
VKDFHPIAVLLIGLTACGGGTSPSGGTTPTQPVIPVPSSITMSLSSVTLTSPGAVASLTATVNDQNGTPMSNQTVIWTSSNEGVATVSGGTVTAVANGSATVTATSGSLSAQASVKVESSSPPPSAANVTVNDNVFNPSATTIALGGQVTWTWSGSQPHNVTFQSGESSATQSSGTFSRTFTAAGSFSYQCTVHSGMQGSVSVD